MPGDYPQPILWPAGKFLDGKDRNETSQFGEDGLIAEALAVFGIANRWCFEVGAADGLFYSNTKRLRDDGWNAVLIEAGDEQFEKLKGFETQAVRVVHETIGPRSLDRILARQGCPTNLDLGVIDIDGQDYWAWCGMQRFRPRLMLVEFAIGDAWRIPEADQGVTFQATLGPIVELGRAKGYTPLAQTHVNVLFVEDSLL